MDKSTSITIQGNVQLQAHQEKNQIQVIENGQ